MRGASARRPNLRGWAERVSWGAGLGEGCRSNAGQMQASKATRADKLKTKMLAVSAEPVPYCLRAPIFSS